MVADTSALPPVPGLSVLVGCPVMVGPDARATVGGCEITLPQVLVDRLEWAGAPAPIAGAGVDRERQAKALYVLLHEREHATSLKPYRGLRSENEANRLAAQTFRFWARRWFGDRLGLLWRALPYAWREA